MAKKGKNCAKTLDHTPTKFKETLKSRRGGLGALQSSAKSGETNKPLSRTY
jgi:hypothetical protein